MQYLLLFLITLVSAAAEQTPSETMEAWVKSYNDNDAVAISSYYEKSESIDLLVSEGHWLRGYKAIAQMYAGSMQGLRFYDSVAENMKHRIIDDIALVSFIHKFKYQFRANKNSFAIHIRTTATLRKTKLGWKILSEHSSSINGVQRKTPIEMKR